MKRVLKDIQTGTFTRTGCWNEAGPASFKATRRLNDEHPIEKVGEKLRGMMPWIRRNKLVDKDKN